MGPAAPRRTDECLLHAVTRRSRRPDGRSELSAESLPSAKPAGVARLFYRLRGTGSHLFASIQPPRFAVEPRCRIYFLRLTFVAFQSRQTPSITRPRSLLAAHDVHQGSRRKIGATEEPETSSQCFAPLCALDKSLTGWTRTLLLLCFSIGLGVDVYVFTTVIREEISQYTGPHDHEAWAQDWTSLERHACHGRGVRLMFLTSDHRYVNAVSLWHSLEWRQGCHRPLCPFCSATLVLLFPPPPHQSCARLRAGPHSPAWLQDMQLLGPSYDEGLFPWSGLFLCPPLETLVVRAARLVLS